MNQKDELRKTSLLLLRGHQKEIVDGHLSAKGRKSFGQEKRGGKRALGGADMVRTHCVLWKYYETRYFVRFVCASKEK